MPFHTHKTLYPPLEPMNASPLTLAIGGNSENLRTDPKMAGYSL